MDNTFQFVATCLFGLEKLLGEEIDALGLKRLETIKARMNRILAENTGKSVEEITLACERDNFMTSQEALEFGLVDRVLEHH